MGTGVPVWRRHAPAPGATRVTRLAGKPFRRYTPLLIRGVWRSW